MINAVIFDLDGVIVSTDEYHYQAWKQLASEHAIPFSRTDNERLRGISRMESLDIILEKSKAHYTDEKKRAMADRKNSIYRKSLNKLSPVDILPGVSLALTELRASSIKVAIGSSSKNAKPILEAIGLIDAFDAIADGTHITWSKPDPEVFLLAAKKLGEKPHNCLVVEDAEAGVEAALAAKMAVLAVGPATRHPHATFQAVDLADVTLETLLSA